MQQRIDFAAERDADIFSAIAAAPAVFVLRGAAGSEPYISKTANLRRRLQRLLAASEGHSKRLNLRLLVHSIEYTLTGSEFESGFLLYLVLRESFPSTYANRLRLRFAPLLKMHMANEYPRASITTRLGRMGGEDVYYGPFASKVAAEKFMNDALDFFKMRRCTDDLNPDPSFPGCVYSEMKMCLAPCFLGCTNGEYRDEVGRVEAFLDSGGDSLKRELEVERESASASMEFEKASAIHGKLEKLAPVMQALPKFVHRIDRLHAVIVQRSAEQEMVAMFRVDGGAISGALQFAISDSTPARSQSMEARIQVALNTFPAATVSTATERMEHLAILRRWCYRGTRDGEIFFANNKGELPMRRLVRGIGRVYKGEAPEDQTGPVAAG